jgi:hypothetical protein
LRCACYGYTEDDCVNNLPTTPQFLPLNGNVVRVVGPDPDNPYQLPGAGVAFSPANETQKSSLREFLKEFVLLSSSDLPTD